MGRASSRPRTRRASGGACFASADAFVDVAGITAERAAEGSGSEWSSENEESAQERAVVPRPEGTVGVAAGSDARVAETRVDDDASASPVRCLPVPPTPASSRSRATPASDGPEKEEQEPHLVVRVFLFTNEKGLHSTARPVTTRLVVTTRSNPLTSPGTFEDVLHISENPKSSTAPFWIGSIAERLAGHAGAWPSWDLTRSSKAKTSVETQLEDFTNAQLYAPTEPRHDERDVRDVRDERNERDERDERSSPPDLSESERFWWSYAGGGMHQPVDEATPASKRWVAERTKEALETSAEVALAVDGERALSPRAAAAAAEVARLLESEVARLEEAGTPALFFSRDANPAAISRKKRAKTPPASETRLPLPATSLAASAKANAKAPFPAPSSETKKPREKEDEAETGTAGVAAFSSADSSKLWGAWSPSVQRRRRRRLDAKRGGESVGDETREDDKDDQRFTQKHEKSLFSAKEDEQKTAEAAESADPRAAVSRRSLVFPGGGSGRSSGYEEEDDPSDKQSGDSDASSGFLLSSDLPTPAATRSVPPARDEERV